MFNTCFLHKNNKKYKFTKTKTGFELTILTICSMTGYAVSVGETCAGTLTTEIKSVNSRFLDLQFRIQDDFRNLEPALRDVIMKRVTRGKVECRLHFSRKTTSTTTLNLNTALLTELANVESVIRQQFTQASTLSVHELLKWPGVLKEIEVNQETLQTEVLAALSRTLDEFIQSKTREGAALQTMLLARIDAMESIVEKITPLVPQAVMHFQNKAIERLQETLNLATQQAHTTHTETMERIRQEVTLYGIRIDVAEELSRLNAHLAETRHILQKGGQVGKRLDFMMQELNREANTLGSKATIKELADASMELKLLIEQIREQVQNLE